MAIADVARYAHLSQSDITALGAELDAIRRDIEDSRGARDAAYIRKTILFQRTLEAVGRLLICDQPFEVRLGAGNRIVGPGEERREHGDRP